jgi:hypothetical protein
MYSSFCTPRRLLRATLLNSPVKARLDHRVQSCGASLYSSEYVAGNLRVMQET